VPRFLLVVNPSAGSTDAEAVAVARSVLADAGAVGDVPDEGDGRDEALRDAARADATVVAVGGDGTLHAAVQRLYDLDVLGDVAVGLVPLGTGNDFARGVGLPLDPGAAAKGIAQGRTRAVDLLVDDAGTVVVNAAHAGLGAAAADRAEGLKSRLGALAYPVGAVSAALREGGYDLRVTVDGDVAHDGPALLVGVLNGPSIGGGTHLCAHAEVDDACLDVVVASGVGLAARTAFGAALRQGTHLDREDVLHLRGQSVTIAGEAVAHDVDGEVLAEIASRTYRVLPRAWRLRAPS
jgi:YegS/Rv2252/BmrU family lipid kinase